MSRNTGKACTWVEGEPVTCYVFILTAPYHSFHRVHTCQLPLSQGKFGVWMCPPGSLGAQETCFNVPKKARAIWSFKISSWEVLKACIPWIKIKDAGKTSWARSHSVQKWTAVLFGEKSVVNCQEGTGNVERKIWRATALIKSPLNPFYGKQGRVLPKRRDEEVTTQSWWTKIHPTSALTLEACWSLFMRRHRPVSVRAQWCMLGQF